MKICLPQPIWIFRERCNRSIPTAPLLCDASHDKPPASGHSLCGFFEYPDEWLPRFHACRRILRFLCRVVCRIAPVLQVITEYICSLYRILTNEHRRLLSIRTPGTDSAAMHSVPGTCSCSATFPYFFQPAGRQARLWRSTESEPYQCSIVRSVCYPARASSPFLTFSGVAGRWFIRTPHAL
jgi:hypothetical protein